MKQISVGSMMVQWKPLGRWMQIAEVPAPKRKTKVFEVHTLDAGLLGQVRWFSPWRRYNFFPAANTSFDERCLLDLAGFCKQLMDARKPRSEDEPYNHDQITDIVAATLR